MHITNRRAFHDYEILETYEAGINLTGPEVKSVKGERVSLDHAFVKIIGSEIYLVNAQIFPYPFARPENYDPKRSRKLLLHKNQIISLKTKLASDNLTLIPLECYNKRGFIKLKIGLAKGRKQYQKREKLKRRDIERETERELRRKI